MAYQIEVRETVPLKPEVAFARLADHNALGSVLMIPVRRTVDGIEEVNGLGSVRKLGLWPLDFDETVTLFKPPERIEYRITRGTPLRKHHGSLRFAASGEGTEIVWTIRYEVPVPLLGAFVREGLRLGIRRGLRRLGRT